MIAKRRADLPTGRGVGCFFGCVAPGVDAVPANVVSPVSPNNERIAVEILEIVFLGLRHQHRQT